MVAPSSRGFTLVELLIVVVILAILAAVAIPGFSDVTEEARHSAFVSELLVWVEAADRYHAKTESYLPDSSSGVFPGVRAGYASPTQFEAATPLGGVWDFELDSFGVKAAVGAHFNGGSVPSATEMGKVDALLDDGDVTTGAFRRLATDCYDYVLAEES